MVMVVLDRRAQRELIRERRRAGGDRHDEVWDGIYIMSPDPNNEHQEIGGDLHFAFKSGLSAVGRVRVLPGNPAEDRDTHWLGGPDFVVEVISRHDRARRKFSFYAKVGVRELLLVDRRPWMLELYRAHGAEMSLVGQVVLGSSEALTSAVLPFSFRLIAGETRPMIEITQTVDARRWLA